MERKGQMAASRRQRPKRSRLLVRKEEINKIALKSFLHRETTLEDRARENGLQAEKAAIVELERQQREKAKELERLRQEDEIALKKKQLEIETQQTQLDRQKLENKELEQEIENQKKRFEQQLEHEIDLIKIMGKVLAALAVIFAISAIFTGSVVLLAGFNVSGFQLETSTINLLIGVTIAEVTGLIVTLLGFWLRALRISNNKK